MENKELIENNEEVEALDEALNTTCEDIQEENEIVEDAITDPYTALNRINCITNDADKVMEEKRKQDVVIESLLGNGINIDKAEAKKEIKRIVERLRNTKVEDAKNMPLEIVEEMLGKNLTDSINNILSESTEEIQQSFKRDLLIHLIESEKIEEMYENQSTKIKNEIQVLQNQLIDSFSTFDNLDRYEELLEQIEKETDEEKKKELKASLNAYSVVLVSEKLIDRILNKSFKQYQKEARQYDKVYKTALKNMKRADKVTYVKGDHMLEEMEFLFEDKKIEAKVFLLSLWREIIRNKDNKEMAILESQLAINLSILCREKQLNKIDSLDKSVMFNKIKELLEKIK